MILKNQLPIILIFMLGICSTLSVTSVTQDSSQANILTESPREYIISDVPYVKQDTNIYCMFACYEMLFRYYGLDASQVEALFNAGAGYSLGYDPVLEKMAEKPHRLILPSYKFYLHTSYEVSQGNKDDEFLCDLYGCDLDKTIIDSSKSSILKWIDYWELFKQNIASDMPVLCCIDPCSWPLYQELENLPASSFLARGAHMIVGVGYNIINRSICFHDPYAGYKNQEEKGKYQWVSMDDFRVSVNRAYYDIAESSYLLYLINKQKESKSKDEIFKIAHERNIERMKGNVEYYDDYVMNSHFHSFGIEAFKSLKQDFKELFKPRLIYYKLTNKFTNGWVPFDMINSYQIESTIKHNISVYLNETADSFENISYQNIAKFDSALLEEESIKLAELANLANELKIILETESIIKAYINVQPVLIRIGLVLDEIIQLEESIVNGEIEE